MIINNVRRKTTDRVLSRRLKKLVKEWQRLVQQSVPSLSNGLPSKASPPHTSSSNNKSVSPKSSESSATTETPSLPSKSVSPVNVTRTPVQGDAISKRNQKLQMLSRPLKKQSNGSPIEKKITLPSQSVAAITTVPIPPVSVTTAAAASPVGSLHNPQPESSHSSLLHPDVSGDGGTYYFSSAHPTTSPPAMTPSVAPTSSMLSQPLVVSVPLRHAEWLLKRKEQSVESRSASTAAMHNDTEQHMTAEQGTGMVKGGSMVREETSRTDEEGKRSLIVTIDCSFFQRKKREKTSSVDELDNGKNATVPRSLQMQENLIESTTHVNNTLHELCTPLGTDTPIGVPSSVALGVHGCLGLDGKWYDWTRAIPGQGHSVNIMPYVYLDGWETLESPNPDS